MWFLFALVVGSLAQMPHVWWHAEGAVGFQMWASPIFNENGSAVFVGSQDSNLYGLDARSGKQLWQHDTQGILMSSPAFDKKNQLVIIGGISGKLTAVTASGPTPSDWTTLLQGGINTAPATSPDGSVVFVTTDANTLNALNVTSGGTLWTTTVCDGCPGGTEVSEPLVDAQGTMVVVGGANGGNQTKALAFNGTILWRYKGGTTRKASVFVADMVILSDPGGVSGLNKANGTVRWRWNVNKQVILSSPVFSLSSPILGRQLLVLLGDNKAGLSIVFALNTNGVEQWRLTIEDQLLRNPDNKATFSPDGTLLLVTGISGNLYGIDADGELRWSYMIPGVSIPRLLSAPICDSSTIYVAAANNSVFSLQYVPPTNKTLSIYNYIKNSSDLQEMARVLGLQSMTALRTLLSSPGGWTFFVPSDDAIKVFSARIGGTGFAVWLEEEAPHVFKYYTLSGVHKTFGLGPFQFIPTQMVNDTMVNLGPNVRQPIFVSIRSPEDMEVDPTMGLRASIETSDMRFSNGVIHIIDTVILPPNRSTEVLRFWSHDEFATLASQNPQSLTVFENTAGVTIFAPSDPAFAKASYWVQSVPKLLNATLANFHVIPKLLYSAALTNGSKLTTTTGDTLLVTVNAAGTFISDGLVVAKVEMFDRLTRTGVIHTISEVLSPMPSVVRPIGSNIFFDRSLSALSGLLSDPSYLPFVTSLSGPGNMTFFAPFNVSPRDTSMSSFLPRSLFSAPQEVYSPSGVGFSYHLATGIRQRSQMGLEFFASRLVDPNWARLGGLGQVIQYVKYNRSAEMTYGVPGNNRTVTQVLPSPVTSSNGIYVYVDQWMIPPPNVEAQLNAAGLTLLVEYLKRVNLMNTVNNLTSVTIFAPSNQAFQQEAYWADNLTPDVLTTVLRHHIVVGALYSNDLTNNRKLTTIAGNTLTVKVDVNGTKFLTSPSSDGSELLMWDLLTSNGVIHSVDVVMSPPSNASVPLIVNMAYRKDLALVTSRIVQQPQFGVLKTLLTSNNFTLTVFVPTNEAWESVTLSDPEIIETMRYSMMNGSFPTSTLGGLQFLPSLLINTSSVSVGENKSQVLQIRTVGQEVSVLFGWDNVNTTDGTAALVQKDIRASNGFLHVVDNVILVPPPAAKAMNLSGLDRLASLVVRAGLQATYDTPAITIFAASDASLQSMDAWSKSVRPDLLALTLKYHVVPKILYSVNMKDGDKLLTLSGDLLTVQVEDGDISLETAEGTRFPLARRDRLTANGVIHEVEDLIEPPPQSNFTMVDNIALQPELYTLSKLLALPVFADVLKVLSGPNVTLLAPSEGAMARLANRTDLASGVIPGYFRLTLNQSLSLHMFPSSLKLSAGQTLSPTVAPTTAKPTTKPTTKPLSSSDDDSSFFPSIGQDIPGPRWPKDGTPLFVETLLDNRTLPGIVRLGNHSQSVKFERFALPNDTIYTLSSGPPLANWTANVVRRDLKAANGFLQIIDQILSPGVPCSGALPPMGLTEMAGLLVPDKNDSHWLDREVGVTVFATTNQAIIDARKLDDLVPETTVRRQAFKGILTVSQLRNIAAATDKSTRKIVMISGDAMAVSVGPDNSVHIGDTHIKDGDYILSNGMMHVVDGLLVAANDNTLSAWIYIAIALGSLLCIAAVIFFFYKRSRESQNFDFHRIPDKKRAGDSD